MKKLFDSDSQASNSSTLDPIGCYDAPSLVNHSANLQSLMQQQAMQVLFISQATQILHHMHIRSIVLFNLEPFHLTFH